MRRTGSIIRIRWRKTSPTILSIVQDADNSIRTFVLTGTEAALQPYEDRRCRVLPGKLDLDEPDRPRQPGRRPWRV